MKYKVGDLIAAAKGGEVNVIAHGCNCFNTMKSGIAPLIAAAFPEAHRADQQTKKGSKEKLGFISGDFSNNVLVLNLYSQYNFTGRREGKMDLDYWALYGALDKMAGLIHSRCRIMGMDPDQIRIGLPKIGAGLAGGDWAVISKMIAGRLRDFDVTIYVLKESDIVIN